MNNLIKSALGAAFGVAVFAAPSVALAQSFTTCLLWEVRTVDSGFGEDSFSSANSGALAPAGGARVTITNDNQGKEALKWADSSGCVQWSADPADGPFLVKVQLKHKDGNGNVIRFHSAPGSVGSSPGIERYAVVGNFTPPAQPHWLTVGDETGNVTASAMARHVLDRHGSVLSNTTIHVGSPASVGPGCTGNSAHFSGSNSNITNGVHHVQVDRCFSGDGQAYRRKFTVAHEIGHAMLALYYGSFSGATNGNEPDSTDTYTAPSGYSSWLDCTPQNEVANGGYGINTLVFSALASREGFAHFVAARAFNDKASTGSFRWFGGTFSLETGPGVSGAGGYRGDVCCPSCTVAQENAINGTGTIGDWMRWLWDAHTNTSSCCNHNLTGLEVFDLYKEAREQITLYTEPRELKAYNPAVRLSMAQTGANACLVQFQNASCGAPKVEDFATYNAVSDYW